MFPVINGIFKGKEQHFFFYDRTKKEVKRKNEDKMKCRMQERKSEVKNEGTKVEGTGE